MNKVIFSNWHKLEHYFKRNNDEILNVSKEDRGTFSLADVCRVGDIVNGEKVIATFLGMNFNYCVYTENYNTFYSWNIKTIQTPKYKYKVIQKENKIAVVKTKE